MEHPDKGLKFVLGPDDGDSYWQPDPAGGYATVKLSPFNLPTNQFAAGIQVVDPGGELRQHGHQRNEEMLFVYEGHGTAIVDGERFPVEPGSIVYAGRWVKHGLVNDGDTQLKIFWVILPPGLETVISALGPARQPGEARPTNIERPENVLEVLANAWFARPDQLPPD